MAVNPTRGAKREKPKKLTPMEEKMQKNLSDGFTGKTKMKLKKKGKK